MNHPNILPDNRAEESTPAEPQDLAPAPRGEQPAPTAWTPPLCPDCHEPLEVNCRSEACLGAAVKALEEEYGPVAAPAPRAPAAAPHAHSCDEGDCEECNAREFEALRAVTAPRAPGDDR